MAKEDINSANRWDEVVGMPVNQANFEATLRLVNGAKWTYAVKNSLAASPSEIGNR